MTNFIELNRLYTTQLIVVILQLVTLATCFGFVWPSSGLQCKPLDTIGKTTLCTLIDINRLKLRY